MDLTALIEQHREALKGIMATLLAMVAGSLASRPGGSATLPRHLHRAVLSLLRPAESAARRLAIVLARGLGPLPAPRWAGPPKTRASILVRDGVGTGIVRRRGAPVPKPLMHLVHRKAAFPRLSFPLLDPLPRLSRRLRRQPGAALPRIGMAGMAALPALPEWRPPRPDDPLDADRLGRRLDALARVLDDLPGLAKRFARWQARRDTALAEGRVHRVSPLRGGRPPAGRLSRYDPDAWARRKTREVDEILAHAHALAHNALADRNLRPDTS